MLVLLSPDRKHQHHLSAHDVEERMKILDEFNRIRDEAAGETDEIGNQGDGEETEKLSPSAQFFLTK